MSILNLEGAYENELSATGDFNPQAPKTALMLPSGQRIVLPTEVLLNASVELAHKGTAEVSSAPIPSPNRDLNATTERETVIPLVEEQLEIRKQQTETARLRLRRITEEEIQKVTVPLTETRWEVEHVAIEKRVESQPEVRQVGTTMIFPLVEERMVVVRELWLREEVHVRQVSTTVEKSADFAIKRDKLVEQRTDLSSAE